MGSKATKPAVAAKRAGNERSPLPIPLLPYLSTAAAAPSGIVTLTRGSVSASLKFNMFSDKPYCHFTFHSICPADEACTVVVGNVSGSHNPEAANIACTSADLLEEWLHILKKDERLTCARIEYYFSRVQESSFAAMKEMKEYCEQNLKTEEEEDSDSDCDGHFQAQHMERQRLRSFKALKPQGIETCIRCTSTVVIIAEERMFVCGPGLLVVAIAGPSGCRIVSTPPADLKAHEHSKLDKVTVCELEGGLKPDEFLVLSLNTSDAYLDAVRNIRVRNTEDVADIALKLGALDSSGEAVAYVLNIERGGSSSG